MAINMTFLISFSTLSWFFPPCSLKTYNSTYCRRAECGSKDHFITAPNTLLLHRYQVVSKNWERNLIILVFSAFFFIHALIFLSSGSHIVKMWRKQKTKTRNLIKPVLSFLLKLLNNFRRHCVRVHWWYSTIHSFL